MACTVPGGPDGEAADSVYTVQIAADAIRRAIERGEMPKPDTLLCSGYSGAMFAALLSHQLGCSVTIVRKPNDSNHGHTVEGVCDARHFLYVDDLVSNGETFRRCLRGVKWAWTDHKLVLPRMCGVYLYEHVGLKTPVQARHMPTVGDLMKVDELGRIVVAWENVE